MRNRIATYSREKNGSAGGATAKWGNDAVLPSATIVLPAGQAVKSWRAVVRSRREPAGTLLLGFRPRILFHPELPCGAESAGDDGP